MRRKGLAHKRPRHLLPRAAGRLLCLGGILSTIFQYSRIFSYLLLRFFYQGLVVAGTVGGVVFVYGDGIQYMRPLCAVGTDGAIFEVSHIIGLTEDRVAVTLGNNSIHVLSLPLLDVVASLPANWLSKRYGDISIITFDNTNRRPFVYVGTTEGFVRVLEASSFIRVCEYNLSRSDAGMTGNVIVSDIQVCPKVCNLVPLLTFVYL